MTFTLVAELPLGVYRGHLAGGDIDLVPSPARLHAALWCAAAQGPRAEADGDQLVPRTADLASLDWLENHPPDLISIPGTTVSGETGVAFRKQGLIVKEGGEWKDKLAGRDVGAGVAVDGPFAWTWTEDPPAEIRESLVELCSDVAYLGMAETPVRLRATTDALPATHQRDLDADLFTGQGVDVTIPEAGRGEALRSAHQAQLARPKASEDRHTTSESIRRRPVVETAVTTARYRDAKQKEPGEHALPWTQVVLAPLSVAIREKDRVRWSVAAHRALIRMVGEGAPSMLTGVFAEGAARPANRVAIHILDHTVAFTGMTDHPSTLALLVPRGIDDADLAVIGAALTRLKTVRGPGGREARIAGRPVLVPGDRFWLAPTGGQVREWQTAVPFVADSRPPRRGPWTLADAVTASVGLVWRDLLSLPPETGRGDAFYRALSRAAGERGARAHRVVRVMEGDPSWWVHKVNPGHVIVPLHVRMSLGALAGNRAVVAIGQSRHLGGGLLRPCDRPAAAGTPAPAQAAGES